MRYLKLVIADCLDKGINVHNTFYRHIQTENHIIKLVTQRYANVVHHSI